MSEQEVNGRIASIAAQHGQRPDQLRADLARSGRISEVARIVYEQKAADRVIANAKIEEVSADQWNEMKGPGGGPSPTTTKKKTTTTKKTAAKTSTKKTAGKKSAKKTTGTKTQSKK